MKYPVQDATKLTSTPRPQKALFTFVALLVACEPKRLSRPPEAELKRSEATPTQSGFTLIELLVVIAIISVLSALLLPSLFGARDKSRETACASQIAQLGLAITMYDDEYGHPPAGRVPAVYNGWEGWRYSSLVGFSARHLGFGNPNWIENDSWVADNFYYGSTSVYHYLEPYIANTRNLGVCTGVKKWSFTAWDSSCLKTSSKATYVWYSGPSARSASGTQYKMSLDDPIHPESAGWGYHDADQENNPQAVWLFSDVGIWDSSSPDYGDAPHGKGRRANKLYADGHVKHGMDPQRPYNWGYMRQNATGF